MTDICYFVYQRSALLYLGYLVLAVLKPCFFSMWSTEAGRAVMADTTLQSSSWGHELGFTWPPLLQVWPLEKSWTIHPLSKSCISKEIELWALLLEWLLRQGPKRGVEAQSLNTEVIKCLGQMVWGISLFWHGWEQGSTVPFWEPVCTFCTSQYGQALVILDILHAWELRASHCSHLPPLKRPSVPAAEAEGHGMSLLEDNTASFLILPVSSPLENFFSAGVLFSSVFKLCRSYEFALIQHVSISSNKGRKRSSWEEFLSAADAEKHFYELLLSFSSKLPFL